MVIDGQTLVLKEDPANPTRFGLTNIGVTGTSKLEHSNIKHTFYETHMRKRNIGGSSRSYTEPHKQPDVPTVEKQLDSYQLPILNADINSTFITLPDDKQPIVDSLNKAVTALNTLKQSTQSASNQTGSTNNDTASKQDALKLLADFAKANPDNLTPDQQKQLSDILAAQKDGQGVSQAQLNGLIDSLNGSIKSQYTEEVRATGNGPTLPNSSLYNIDPNNPNGYLVETDPAFANYKTWLSSSYMMQRLGLDPSNMHKRLGDGYYEQGLIRDQVMTLTGRRFLGDYTTDDAMYQALMDNGVTVAKAMNLRPGIALTAEQMAQLTTDIVWLVEQTITLKDGSKQTVLVPKVYVRSKVGDLKGDSSLIAARNMDMQFTGDLSNQGNIVAHNGLRIQANNLNNQNGGVIQGNFVQINTKNDLNNLGATLKANNAMALDVGGKLNNSTTTYHTESKAGQSNAWRTGIDQIGQIYVGDGLKGKTDDNGRPLTTLSIDVGGNATFNAGQLINQGGTSRLVAGGDVALNAVNTGFQTNAIGDSNNYYKVGQTQDIGSVVASQGSTYIQSKGGSITGTAVTIHSEDGSSYLDANKDITLKEGRATSNLETAIKTTEKSLLSRKTTQDRNSATSDEAISGNVTGDRVVINAGNDIQLTATNAISQSGTTLKAGNNLTLDAAENRYSQSSSHNQKKSGLFGNGGASFTLGTQKTANDNRTDSTTHTGSVVGTYNGNTVLTAGDHYQQTGSKVFAQNQTTDNPKDLNYGTTVINAKSANVTNTTATTESHNSQSQKTTGLTVSVSNSLIDQAQGINSLAKAGETTNSDQMKVMAGVAGFNKLRTLGKGAQAAADSLQKNGLSEAGLKGVGNTRIQATIGSQSSKSNQDSLSGNNEASSIDTNNLVLNIQGKGKDSDFVVTGSDLNVNGDLYNNVEGDVVYQAATGKGYERSSNKSSGYGVGVYADSKSQGFTVNANTAKGYGNGETTTNANSHVTVGGTTYQNIGGDLVLDGAVVKGDHMSGHIDGAILAKSRPDTATYTGKQTNAGVSADIGFDGVPQSVSVNAGRSKVNADYAAVKEQTGIAMNSSDVVVAKASRFDGAYFTTATPEDNQTVFKEGVTTTDIQNHMNYKGDAINVGLGAGINSETQKVSPPGISGIGYGKDGDSQTSTTYSAVTGIAGKSDVTTANVGTLNETLVNSFDKDRVNAQTNAQVSVTQAFGQEAPKAVAEFSQNRINAIKADPNLTPDQKLAEIKKWDEGGVYRVAMHTAIGALGGGTVESALVGGGVAAAAPLINDLEEKIARRLTEQGMGKESAKSVAKSLTSFTLAGVGSTVGLETSSTATAINIDSNNRWLHESEIQKILANNGDKVRQFAKEQNITFEEAWRAILAQAYRNTDDQFRNNHTPKPGTKESTLAMAAEAFLRKNVVIKSTAAERQNHDLNRSNPRTNAILWAVENRTPTYSTTQKNTQIAKQVAKTSGIGVLKGVGNIPSDTVNGVVAPFGRSVPQTFPYSNEEEANVGQVAQNGVGVATVFAGAKVPYGGISKTKVPARGGRTGVVGKVEPVVQQKPVQANNESKQKPIGIGKQAHNINAQIALKSKLAGLEKAQSTAVKTRTLSDGRIRYYSAETPAKKEGKTRGASFVTEYNPKTGKTRQWMESYNHSGEVIRVHPKSINGQTVSGQHYPPTGTEVQKGAK